MHRIALRAALAAVVVFALAACGETREEKFEKAMRAAEAARANVEAAQKQVDDRQTVVEEAQAKVAEAQRKESEAQEQLDAARERLATANDALASARAEVAKWADDATLFRNVQERLLEDRDLEDAAVSARVDHGIAVLQGTVPDETARDRAIAIARATPGIVDVQSQLTIAAPAAAAPEAAPFPPQVPSAVEPEPGPEMPPAAPPAAATAPEAAPESAPETAHEIAPGTEDTAPAPAAAH